MPEGPELRLVSQYITKLGDDYKFGGPIKLSALSEQRGLPDVKFHSQEYDLYAKSRGKELKMVLHDKTEARPQLTLKFHMGISGYFKFTEMDMIPHNVKLSFQTKSGTHVLAFCDDIGGLAVWEASTEWDRNRGPDALDEPETFRDQILNNLDQKVFNRPICECLLNQQYFNGIGNYLRAEILFRSGVKPFDQGRSVLINLPWKQDVDYETPDILDLCTIVQKEVIDMGVGKEHDSNSDNPERAARFKAWLRCYSKAGMSKVRDSSGRMAWFKGEPGPMLPKKALVRIHETDDLEDQLCDRRRSDGGTSSNVSNDSSTCSLKSIKCCPICPVDGFI